MSKYSVRIWVSLFCLLSLSASAEEADKSSSRLENFKRKTLDIIQTRVDAQYYERLYLGKEHKFDDKEEGIFPTSEETVPLRKQVADFSKFDNLEKEAKLYAYFRVIKTGMKKATYQKFLQENKWRYDGAAKELSELKPGIVPTNTNLDQLTPSFFKAQCDAFSDHDNRIFGRIEDSFREIFKDQLTKTDTNDLSYYGDTSVADLSTKTIADAVMARLKEDGSLHPSQGHLKRLLNEELVAHWAQQSEKRKSKEENLKQQIPNPPDKLKAFPEFEKPDFNVRLFLEKLHTDREYIPSFEKTIKTSPNRAALLTALNEAHRFAIDSLKQESSTAFMLRFLNSTDPLSEERVYEDAFQFAFAEKEEKPRPEWARRQDAQKFADSVLAQPLAEHKFEGKLFASSMPKWNEYVAKKTKALKDLASFQESVVETEKELSNITRLSAPEKILDDGYQVVRDNPYYTTGLGIGALVAAKVVHSVKVNKNLRNQNLKLAAQEEVVKEESANQHSLKNHHFCIAVLGRLNANPSNKIPMFNHFAQQAKQEAWNDLQKVKQQVELVKADPSKLSRSSVADVWNRDLLWQPRDEKVTQLLNANDNVYLDLGGPERMRSNLKFIGKLSDSEQPISAQEQVKRTYGKTRMETTDHKIQTVEYDREGNVFVFDESGTIPDFGYNPTTHTVFLPTHSDQGLWTGWKPTYSMRTPGKIEPYMFNLRNQVSAQLSLEEILMHPRVTAYFAQDKERQGTVPHAGWISWKKSQGDGVQHTVEFDGKKYKMKTIDQDNFLYDAENSKPVIAINSRTGGVFFPVNDEAGNPKGWEPRLSISKYGTFQDWGASETPGPTSFTLANKGAGTELAIHRKTIYILGKRFNLVKDTNSPTVWVFREGETEPLTGWNLATRSYLTKGADGNWQTSKTPSDHDLFEFNGIDSALARPNPR